MSRSTAAPDNTDSARRRAESAGWKYDHSEALGMDYATRQTPDGPEVMTADRVRYSPAEVRMLSQAGGVDQAVHWTKQVFSGEVVAVRPGPAFAPERSLKGTGKKSSENRIFPSSSC